MIKKAMKTDIEEICRLRVLQQKDDWKEEYIDKFNLYDSTKTFLENHLNKDLHIFLNVVDGYIVSTGGLQIIEYLPQCNDNGKYGYICDVYTLDKYRRKGLQKELLNEIIKFSKTQKLYKLSLSSDNEDAINLYKKMGFEYDHLVMNLSLLND